jgi:SAM-dependent methyltransferase
VENLYETIGPGYRRHRRPDHRIRRALWDAVGSGSVVNVGAGTGSYEPVDRLVVAVEPSMQMIRQRPAGSAPAVQASASRLPFKDATFDCSLAVLTIHHWPQWKTGIQELARAARGRVVLFTWDPSAAGFWLVRDYFPELLDVDRRIFPSMEALSAELGRVRVIPVPIPHDCTDGFLGAYWRRPHMYLKPSVRRAISTFSKVGAVATGLGRLRADLETGEWHRRNGALLGLEHLDLGYRVVVGG